MLWQNSASVIVGRHQCTQEVVNTAFVARHAIPVIRRLSGGGAVYHDLGNLNFSFLRKTKTLSPDCQSILRPLLHALESLGLAVKHTGRNDLEVQGKKISGISQARVGSTHLVHGTLLVDVDQDVLAEVLKVDLAKIQSKGIRSVAARVCNLAQIWPGASVERLTEVLLEHCATDTITLTEAVLTEARTCMEQKYSQWSWNFGASPPWSEERSKRFPWGSVCLRLDIKGGIVRACSISGDFFALRPVEELERLFVGKAWREEVLCPLIRDLPWQAYFLHCDPAQMQRFFLGTR